MEPDDKEAVLMAAVHAPGLVMRVGLQYLRMKRSAIKARERFYRELVKSGMPTGDAKILADEYASLVSVRNLVRTKAFGWGRAEW
ncbi:MAG: hypothetical protein SA339_09485 [Methanomassiliicoccus sp.]|nr:hypothetical protein [Methanomassiliicoccus sp.]